MKSYYIIYKCFKDTRGKFERISQWYGRFPANNDEEAKQECRTVWAEHQGEDLKKEIMLLDANKETLFEHRTHPKGSIPFYI